MSDVGGRRTRRRPDGGRRRNPLPQVAARSRVAPFAAERELDLAGALHPAARGLSILFLYPFVWLISAAFKPRGETFDNRLIPHALGLELHRRRTCRSPYPQYLFNVAPVGALDLQQPLDQLPRRRAA